jgi:Asp/Glu/hydantoin racemase
MNAPHAAIIDLREPVIGVAQGSIESALRVAEGVGQVVMAEESPRIRVWFDADRIGLGDIVAMIEKLGRPVRAVGQLRLL